ncbi:MAG: GNAT family N-acetyltransferase [Ignavibacteriaceae bacterium]
MSERLYLRALKIDDSELINTWRNNHKITDFLAGNFFYVSPEREKSSLEKKILDDSKNIYLGVCLRKDNRLIGYVQVNNIDLRNLKAEWGGTLIGDLDFWGKGYGEEASKLLLRFLFNEYPINKCYAYCLEEHPTTEKLFIKLGFKKDGKLRQEVFKKGVFKNLVIYSLLRSEIDGQF